MLGRGGERRAIARDMVRRADAARDAGRFREAAMLYAESLRLTPDKAGIHVQAGHMYKESGEHGSAEAHYRRAEELKPGDHDLQLQLGHFYKSTGRLREAESAYRRAGELKPGWAVPASELAGLAQAGWQTPAGEAADAPIDFLGEPGALTVLPTGLAPDLARGNRHDLPAAPGETIELKRLGRRERSHWGVMQTLRGVEAVRGYGLSRTPIAEVQLILNEQMVFRGPVRGGYRLAREGHDQALLKYVFNIWFDFSDFTPGRYEIETRLIDAKGRTQSRRDAITIAPALTEAEYPDCDGVVSGLNPAAPIEPQINARPSMVRDSFRTFLLKQSPRAVLIQRADQLGDMVVSIPALRRLREILPEAKLVGLLSNANADLARSLGLFDDIIVIDFHDDSWERRRVMELPEQEALRARLAPYRFDMAIDLSENESSRPLLTLSGAPFLFGFRSGKVPSLNVEIEGNTHDRWDGHEVVPHTNKLMGLIEWLGAMLKKQSSVVRRDDLDRGRLTAFGIGAGDRFAVLHDGARLKFSRWPHYAALAQTLLDQTDLKVVMLTDDAALRAGLPADLARSERFHLVDGKLAFDDFDALMHWASVFVGNDSGPKHLASLRGAPVVSLHMARNNWNEWGQENGGFIISRRVPCTGCLIWHDPEECGKDFACMRDIGLDEVFGAVRRLL